MCRSRVTVIRAARGSGGNSLAQPVVSHRTGPRGLPHCMRCAIYTPQQSPVSSQIVTSTRSVGSRSFASNFGISIISSFVPHALLEPAGLTNFFATGSSDAFGRWPKEKRIIARLGSAGLVRAGLGAHACVCKKSSTQAQAPSPRTRMHELRRILGQREVTRKELHFPTGSSFPPMRPSWIAVSVLDAVIHWIIEAMTWEAQPPISQVFFPHPFDTFLPGPCLSEARAFEFGALRDMAQLTKWRSTCRPRCHGCKAKSSKDRSRRGTIATSCPRTHVRNNQGLSQRVVITFN